jgi:hypothetical protein
MTFKKGIELHEIIAGIVDSIRNTSAITSITLEGNYYRYTSSNSLSKNDYISLTDGVTTWEDKRIIEADSDSFVLDTEYIATSYKANAPYFMHEKEKKSANILTEKTNQDTYKWQKYPLVLLTHPYTDTRDLLNSNYSSTFKILIITITESDYWADDRYKTNFDPKLLPIYEDLINAMSNSSSILENNPYLIEHDKIDILNVEGNPFPDTMDAISLEFTDLNINIPYDCTPVGVKEFVLTMSSDDETQGLTLPAVGAHTYTEGANVTVYPVPKTGYEWLKWQLNGVDSPTENPTITMDANQTARAFYQEKERTGFPYKFPLTLS